MKPIPFVTVLIPVRNEKQYLIRSLTSVVNQDYPAEAMEIWIIDGMSTDGTREMIPAFQERFPNLRWADNPGKIVPTGLNIAIQKSSGDIIIRVDGHCEIAPDYVSRCVKHIQEDQVDGAGGPMQTIGETPLSRAIAVAMSSAFGVGGSAFRTLRGRTMLADSVPFPAYTRAIVEKVGLYDEELVRNQDDEYNYRIREAGGKILLAADVGSQYYSRGSLGKLWKQYYQYGYWKVRVLQKHPRQMMARQFVPPAFVLALLVALVLCLVPPLGWAALAFVAGSYLLANLAASVLTAAGRGWEFLAALPLIFAILHISYGAGFLVGLIHFRGRWSDRVGLVPHYEQPRK
jgi:succinoglycan biosynthesis protein ExoA